MTSVAEYDSMSSHRRKLLSLFEHLAQEPLLQSTGQEVLNKLRNHEHRYPPKRGVSHFNSEHLLMG